MAYDDLTILDLKKRSGLTIGVLIHSLDKRQGAPIRHERDTARFNQPI